MVGVRSETQPPLLRSASDPSHPDKSSQILYVLRFVFFEDGLLVSTGGRPSSLV